MSIMCDVKPFQETLHASMCGPASVKIVLAYYGIEKSEAELASLCGTDNDLGTDARGIMNAAQNFGLHVEIKDNCSLKDIECWLQKDVPVIVNWFTRGRTDYTDADVADGHYSVVCGLDDEHIYLQDPEIGGIRRVERDDFMTVWFDFSGRYINREELILRQIIAIYP